MTARLRCASLLLLFLACACARLPTRPELAQEHALALGEQTRIDALVAPAAARHPGLSGFRLVADGVEAFALRGLTARAAGRSLDIQSYIWHDDLTGRLLAGEALDAADRGVRVRILLDDLNARAHSRTLRVLDTHPHIAIRVYNPFVSRTGKLRAGLEAAGSFQRINRRAHNKSWIADGRLAITGGRNVGDEYFMASADANFQDLDLLVAGPAASALEQAFDAYWNAASAWPIALIDHSEPTAGELETLRQTLRKDQQAAAQQAWGQSMREADALDKLQQGKFDLRWTADWRLLLDDADKIVLPIPDVQPSQVLAGLRTAFEAARSDIEVISPYFVPGESGTQGLVDGVHAGLRIRVLTNSLASNDVAAVYGGYTRYRKALACGGVALWELKAQGGGMANASLFGSSGASLHSKAAVMDGQVLFVGSLNLDPRSVRLNSEQGLLVRDPVLAAQLVRLFDTLTSPQDAWAVGCEGGKHLVWRDASGERNSEPPAGFMRKIVAALSRWLPVEPLL